MRDDIQYYGICPRCGGSADERVLKVIKTDRPYRLIACKVCGHRFKTIELIESKFTQTVEAVQKIDWQSIRKLHTR